MLDWIENHGEAFLSKHTGVGKSLHRARALQKRHDDFEEVAQVRRGVCVCVYGLRDTRAMAVVFAGACQVDSPWFPPDARRPLSTIGSAGEW